MTESSDRSLATVLLTTHLLRRPEPPLSPKEFSELIRSIEDPARLMGNDAVRIQSLTGFGESEAQRLAALLDGAEALEVERERLGVSGIRILSQYDEGYPARLLDRLGTAAPPVLHVAGNPDLLSVDGVGVVGSRSVGREARRAAEEVARAAVSAGLPVVSGAAKGIDQTAMAAALEAGGKVIGLPADSLERLLGDHSVAEVLEEGRMCLATPYSPSAGFSVGAAMGRNKLIYGLSQVTLVVTSDDGSGGTWAGATEALQRSFAPVAVWTGPGAGPGNARLLRNGGVEVQSAQKVIEITRQDEPHRQTTAESQLRMVF